MEAAVGLLWRVPVKTPRLQYVVKVFFEHWFPLPYKIVSVAEWSDFNKPTGWRVISYGTSELGPADVSIPYSGFIEREGVDFVLPPWNAGGFFPGEGDLPWDLPAMAFYVLTLYALYDWHYGYDEWGLYAWERSPFYTAPFWQEPFVLMRLYELLERLSLRLPRPSFTWEIGWDIDHLYAWKGRGGLRWWLGGLRRGDLMKRLQTRWGRQSDPYDTLDAITNHFPPMRSRFFFLLSQAHARDSLISPSHPDIKRRVQELVGKGYEVGIHPSFTTREDPKKLVQEKNLLE
ncbi:MAG: hypothetical protein RMJ66_08545, partial [Bacteroidia bacterium]|nr:hypothetical protein [Bacteroidia bacterium]MDW8135096.1 hypothetical protein [Bacteroidia bacterium]